MMELAPLLHNLNVHKRLNYLLKLSRQTMTLLLTALLVLMAQLELLAPVQKKKRKKKRRRGRRVKLT